MRVLPKLGLVASLALLAGFALPGARVSPARAAGPHVIKTIDLGAGFDADRVGVSDLVFGKVYVTGENNNTVLAVNTVTGGTTPITDPNFNHPTAVGVLPNLHR